MMITLSRLGLGGASLGNLYAGRMDDEGFAVPADHRRRLARTGTPKRGIGRGAACAGALDRPLLAEGLLRPDAPH